MQLAIIYAKIITNIFPRRQPNETKRQETQKQRQQQKRRNNSNENENENERKQWQWQEIGRKEEMCTIRFSRWGTQSSDDKQPRRTNTEVT